MHAAEGMSARDFPAPPTIEQIAARFPGSIFTLLPQPSIREIGWGSYAENGDVQEVSATYAVFRNSDNLDDPSNFVSDVETIEEHLRNAERTNQPPWFLESVRNARYPMAWEAVRSTRRRSDTEESLADLLVHHLNHVLINAVAARRTGGVGVPPELIFPVTVASARPAPVSVNDVDLNGLVIENDPDAIGWVTQVDQTAVSLVLAREFLPLIDPRLVTRAV